MEHQKAKITASGISFARGRLKAIMAGIEWEYRRCYDPERGKAILAVMLPYMFEVYTLDEAMTFDKAHQIISYWLPGVIDELGPEGYGREWDWLAEKRSTAVASQFARVRHRGKPVYWLPKAQEITKLFALTRADRDAINGRQVRHGGKRAIIGIPVIDPLSSTEKKAKDRQRKTKSNRSKGMRPQGERTINKTLHGIATRSKIGTATLYRHKSKGNLLSYLQKRGVVLTEAERKTIENFPCHNGNI